MYIKWECVEKYGVYGPPNLTYLTACVAFPEVDGLDLVQERRNSIDHC